MFGKDWGGLDLRLPQVQIIGGRCSWAVAKKMARGHERIYSIS
jgi:hypothetical protein